MVIFLSKFNFAINIIITKFTASFKISISAIKIFLLFKYILYIYYLLWFKKDQAKVKALLNFDNKINIKIFFYIGKPDLKV